MRAPRVASFLKSTSPRVNEFLISYGGDASSGGFVLTSQRLWMHASKSAPNDGILLSNIADFAKSKGVFHISAQFRLNDGTEIEFKNLDWFPREEVLRDTLKRIHDYGEYRLSAAETDAVSSAEEAPADWTKSEKTAGRVAGALLALIAFFLVLSQIPKSRITMVHIAIVLGTTWGAYMAGAGIGRMLAAILVPAKKHPQQPNETQSPDD